MIRKDSHRHRRAEFEAAYQPVSAAVQPGTHFLDVTIEFGPLRRTRRISVPVPACRGVSVVLAYSRMWGNFTKKPSITPY